MLIGIDAGNTHITVGLFEEGCEPLHAWRFNTIPNATSDELASLLFARMAPAALDWGRLDAAVVSCVVPALDWPLKQLFREILHIQDPLFVDYRTDSGLVFDYPNPAEIGADRIVNAAAALVLYGAPLILIDFGTATTFCCISGRGAYLGGQILPGVMTSLNALTNRAAKLSAVRIARPPAAIGKSTEAGLVAGSYYQALGAVEGITAALAAEMGETPRVVATGGLASLFAGASPVIGVIDGDLTLKGLKLIHDRRSGGAS
jgi:type III pantothenate kinase